MHNKKTAKNLLLLIFTLFLLISGLGIGTYLFLIIGSKIVEKPVKIKTNYLQIGILSNKDNYMPLVKYLNQQLGSQLLINIDGDKNISYQEVKKRIASKEWDIVFTLSPMLSIAAKDNGYTFIARMFPDRPAYYQSVLFVRADNYIKSIEDIKPSTKIALGDFNSASSFYMPAYDLYGKTLNVTMGLRGHIIREMVKKGEVEVGSAAYGDIVKDDPDIRIIHQSRNIPSSGVYLSPRFDKQDKEIIIRTIENAPSVLKKQANFGKDKEPDFSSFQEITRRTEQVLVCSDFTKNPVNFFCQDKSINTIANKNLNVENIINGRVNGWSRSSSTSIYLSLSGDDNQIYRVILAEEILNQVPNAGNILSLQNKRVEINNVVVKKLPNNILELKISQPNQLKVANP
ncbi:PhnD/SsuA/transferrin family substrate-binding protein [Nostoc sp. FACHB-973]|nr:PhnD/SsuA/transferrin family substrate-binding protein [Nostoc sp. FACHB-973]